MPDVSEVATGMEKESDCDSQKEGGRKMSVNKFPKCPKCGSKSLTIGLSERTLMYSAPFTDELGRLHNHDPNISTDHYTCRKCGHEFTEKTTSKCWCGWPEKEEGA